MTQFTNVTSYLWVQNALSPCSLRECIKFVIILAKSPCQVCSEFPDVHNYIWLYICTGFVGWSLLKSIYCLFIGCCSLLTIAARFSSPAGHFGTAIYLRSIAPFTSSNPRTTKALHWFQYSIEGCCTPAQFLLAFEALPAPSSSVSLFT